MEREPARLSLLTLNVLGVPFARHTRARLQTLGREVAARDIDVICLQEVQYRRYVPLLRDIFSSHPYHAFEPFVHAPKGGLMLLSRWPIKRQDFVLYKKRGRIASPAVADWILHKGILSARLECGSLPLPWSILTWSRITRPIGHGRTGMCAISGRN